MASFICVFQQNSATLFYIAAIGTTGDIDLLISGKQGFQIQDDLPDDKTPGYIYDATEQNQYVQDPFQTPLNEISKF